MWRREVWYISEGPDASIFSVEVTSTLKMQQVRTYRVEVISTLKMEVTSVTIYHYSTNVTGSPSHVQRVLLTSFKSVCTLHYMFRHSQSRHTTQQEETPSTIKYTSAYMGLHIQC
jgi:hypothetical protein